MASCLHCGREYDQSKSPYIGLGPTCGSKVSGFHPPNLKLKSYTQDELDNLNFSLEEEVWVSGEYKKPGAWNNVQFNAEFIFKLSKDFRNPVLLGACVDSINDPKEKAQLAKMVLQDKNVSSDYLAALAFAGLAEAYQHPNFNLRRLNLEGNTRFTHNELAVALAIYRNPVLTESAFETTHDWVASVSNGDKINTLAVGDASIPLKTRLQLVKAIDHSFLNKETVQSVVDSNEPELKEAFFKMMDESVATLDPKSKNLATNYTDELRSDKDQVRRYTNVLYLAQARKKTKAEIDDIKRSLNFYQNQVDTLEVIISNHPKLSQELKNLAELFE
jgi:hypothetical protein